VRWALYQLLEALEFAHGVKPYAVTSVFLIRRKLHHLIDCLIGWLIYW
jgi:hypothetical protein